MSVSGISTTNFYSTEPTQSDVQQFQQLGQDLRLGNLSAPPSDFATLQELRPQSSSAPASQNNHAIAQIFARFSRDLESGNLSPAQQDSTTIQQEMNSRRPHAPRHHNGGSASGTNAIRKVPDPLVRALQSAGLSSAQSAFAALPQDPQELNQNSGQAAFPSGSSSTSNSVDV